MPQFPAKSPQKSSKIDSYFKTNSDNMSPPSGKSRKRKIEQTNDEDDKSSKKIKNDDFDSSSNLTDIDYSNLSSEKNLQIKSDGNDVDSKKMKCGINGEESLEPSLSENKNNVNESVSSFVVTPCESSTWEEIPGELLVYTRKGVEARPKVSADNIVQY